jgi:leucyl-tRNA synthetase
MKSKYNHKKIEEKWNRSWEEKRTYRPDLKRASRPFYNLMMFPYPSAEGLHVGNVFSFVGSDIQGRYKKARGYDVFEPIGFDAFGMHSENYALKTGTHPWFMIEENIKRFREKQLKRIGNMFDWSHEISTTDPEYYRWTQWIFLKLYKMGLAYRKNDEVNWCPSCKTVLADEQAEDGRCERCSTSVQRRNMKQWFFRITAYAPKLLENLGWIDWSDITKNAQRRWIGRSEGVEIFFDTAESDRKITVFTTRPDTLWGATFMILAPEHPLVHELTVGERKAEVKIYLEACSKESRIQREDMSRMKTGVFTGAYAVNPATERRIPIWVSDYVLISHGTGAVMAVPAHDNRDFEFAKVFNLPITEVINRDGIAENPDSIMSAYEEEGILVNSGQFSGMRSTEAGNRIISWLSENGKGSPRVNYRLHDWCISRQRYWGPPIPIIYCAGCGAIPVPEEDLPVILPYIENFEPDGSGLSPLAGDSEFLKTVCPRCGKSARRETDVSDNFLDSAWYFLRYPSSDCSDRAFDKELTDKWLPVDMYIGGNEHAVLHLMYTRFITMSLHEMGLISFTEPFKVFRANGLIVKDGAKMSKSKGNVINPDNYLEIYGADVFRTYLMFSGNFQEGGNFRDINIVGIQRFLDRIWRFATETDLCENPVTDKNILSMVHKKIKKATQDIERLHYNTAIAAIMELFQGITDEKAHYREFLVALLKLLAPFAPFITHELWERLGGEGMLCEQSWPVYNDSYFEDEEVEFVLQVNGKIRDKLMLPADASQDYVERIALNRDRIQSYLKDKQVVKIFFVPGKLLNIAAKE